MKLLLSLVVCSSLFVSGCSSLTVAQRQTVSAVVGVGAGVAQQVASATLQYVISRAGSSADLTKKANLLDSLAADARTLEGDVGPVGYGMIVNTARAATDPTKTHWNELAQSLGQIIMGSGLPKDVAIEQTAVALNQTAAQARTEAASPTQVRIYPAGAPWPLVVTREDA